MTVRFLTPASDELANAVHYYEEQRIGLGNEFLEELDRIIDLIRTFPAAWPELKGNVRRALLSRFPFGIFYRVIGNEIVIAAVMDLRRDPDSYDIQ